MKRITALILVMVMLLFAMIACQKDTKTPAETAASAETTVPAETLDPNDRKNAKDGLPADFTMKGETVGVLTRTSYRKIDWDGGDAKDSEVLAQAVFNRTEAVQNRLGLTFAVTEAEVNWKDYGGVLKENILAGDDTWQIVLTAGNSSIHQGNDYLFNDVRENPYLDFEREWWATDVMEKMSIDGKTVRFMMGDATMNTYFWAYVSYFNKRIYEDNFGDSDELYKKAIAGQWYYDDMIEMVEEAANDVDGNGLIDEGDTFGFVIDNEAQFGFMQDAAGFTTHTRNAAGYPVLEHDLERGMEVLQKFYTLCYDTPGVYTDIAYYRQFTNSTIFTEGKTLFYFNTLESTDREYYRNMQDDYGILPMPKVDDKQQDYVAPITTSATFLTIPVTCTDERIGGVIEALASESYRSVVEVFYESALKTKYSRDSYSGQCIDIVKDSLFKDFFTEYFLVVGDTYFLRTALNNKTNNYVSRYEALADSINVKIVETIDAIKKASEG